MSKRACAVLAVACLAWASGEAIAGIPVYSNQSPNPAAPALNPQPFTKSGVAAPAGTFWSEVQNDAGVTSSSNTNAGSSGNRVQSTAGIGQFRLADDFTVPAGGWNIESVRLYGYQTGFTAGGSPVNAANLRIWDGRPGDTGSNVVFGDTTTNRLTSSAWNNMFRIFNTVAPPPGSAPGTTRRIFENVLSVNTTLPAGTYWLDWQFDTVNTAGAWFMPTTTHEGSRTPPGPANARQAVSSGGLLVWQDVIDAGNPSATTPDVPHEMPFIIELVPEPTSMLTVASLAGLALIRRRRSA